MGLFCRGWVCMGLVCRGLVCRGLIWGGWLLWLTCAVWEATILKDFNGVFSVSVDGCVLHVIETCSMIW